MGGIVRGEESGTDGLETDGLGTDSLSRNRQSLNRQSLNGKVDTWKVAPKS